MVCGQQRAPPSCANTLPLDKTSRGIVGLRSLKVESELLCIGQPTLASSEPPEDTDIDSACDINTCTHVTSKANNPKGCRSGLRS
jgi:hypothetical protein